MRIERIPRISPAGTVLFDLKLLRFLREELPSSLYWVTCGSPSGRHARKRRIECADQDRSSPRPVGTISVADPTIRITADGWPRSRLGCRRAPTNCERRQPRHLWSARIDRPWTQYPFALPPSGHEQLPGRGDFPLARQVFAFADLISAATRARWPNAAFRSGHASMAQPRRVSVASIQLRSSLPCSIACIFFSSIACFLCAAA